MQRALEQYLETKRHVFPRFYFISNEDLLEILANARKPELIQVHIKKLFENIKFLTLSKVSIHEYISFESIQFFLIVKLQEKERKRIYDKKLIFIRSIDERSIILLIFKMILMSPRTISQSVTGKQLAIAMNSGEGEFVDFNEPVVLEGQVERWLCEIGKMFLLLQK